MLEWIQHIDTKLFFHVNHCMKNDVFDLIMPMVRDKYFWIPLYVLLASLIVYKNGLKAIYVIGYALIALLLADQISAHVIKPLVMRARPCNSGEIGHMVHHLVDCGSGYSFVSSHASNHFALAFYFISVFARPSNRFYIVLGFLFWAALISFAQVYVGVHYPFDVIAGAILGGFIGWGLGWANCYTMCYRSGKRL